MSTQTEHYQLSLREGTDIFNPLSTNDNFEKIDELLFQGASGGMVTGTPVVSGGTLSFQGLTLVAADTVVKFKLDASHSVNQVTFAGSTIAIVDLSGNNKTLTGGFWIGYVDTNSKFRVMAWPEVVNAQTFEGQSASYYATAQGLQSVNETAANALSTATAATTVANQALEAATAKGAETTVWTGTNTTTFTAQTLSLSGVPGNWTKINIYSIATSSATTIPLAEKFTFVIPDTLTDNTSFTAAIMQTQFSGSTPDAIQCRRGFTLNTSANTISFTNGYYQSNNTSASVAIPVKITVE